MARRLSRRWTAGSFRLRRRLPGLYNHGSHGFFAPQGNWTGGDGMLERTFRLTENGTDVRTEVLAGLTTFLTMAYIIFVQPAVLSGRMFGIDTGMDFGAVMTAWQRVRHSEAST
jgi:hypothetical protein